MIPLIPCRYSGLWVSFRPIPFIETTPAKFTGICLNTPILRQRKPNLRKPLLSCARVLSSARSNSLNMAKKQAIVSGCARKSICWLLSGGASACKDIVTMLQSPDALMRKYAVVGARKAATTDQQPLQYAASADDPDVKEFARTSLSLL